MKYRETYIEKDLTLVDSGDKTIELKTADPISELYIKFYATNGATSNKSAPIPRIITKIEVLAGADKLFSMDGRLAHALAYNRSGKIPFLTLNEAANYVQSVHIPIRFGRWLWDPLYALVPQAFKNLQLKITWNLAAVRAVGATGFLTGSGKLTVIAKTMEGLDTPPSGFIMSKEHYSFTSAASGDEPAELPVDHPYTDIMVRAYESGVEVTDSITNLKLSLDFDKDLPFDYSAVDLYGQMVSKLGEFNLPSIIVADDGEAHQAWVGKPSAISITPSTQAVIAAISALANGQYTVEQVNDAAVAQNSIVSFVNVVGQMLWNCFYHQFGNFDEPQQYLIAPEHGDIKLKLTQGNAGAEVNVVLGQLRLYAAGGA